MFQHLLVPLDGSTVSELALPPALTIAAAFRGQIILLRVVTIPYIVGGRGNDFTEPYIVFVQNRHREAQTYIKQKVSSLQASGYPVHGLVIWGESVATTILNVADHFAVDAIVMGTRGHGGIYRWLLGSVADQVLRCSTVPVLLTSSLLNPRFVNRIPDVVVMGTS